jgi:hypothetical protein
MLELPVAHLIVRHPPFVVSCTIEPPVQDGVKLVTLWQFAAKAEEATSEKRSTSTTRSFILQSERHYYKSVVN